MTQKFTIDFIVIGFPKCASSWLVEILSKHPEICMSKIKDNGFFIYHRVNKKNLSKFNDLMYDCNCRNKKIGDGNAGYVYHPKVLKSLKQHYPHLKYILILRNPVESFISGYANHLRGSFFRKKIDHFLKDKDYVNLWFYYKIIQENILRNFKKEDVFFIILEEIRNDKDLFKKLFKFLGVKPIEVKGVDKKVNKGYIPKNYFISRLIYICKKIYKHFFYFNRNSWVLKTLKYFRIYNAIKWLERKNLYDKEKKSHFENIKPHLKKIYYEDVKKLSELLSKDLLQIWNFTK